MIPIHNIYYMLSYAFHVLNEQGYKNIETEQFENTAELCAAILIKGVSFQIKRGLGKGYIENTDTLSSLRGRICITDSVKTRSTLKRQLICTYDVFSENTYLNRIIKTTMGLLIHTDIGKKWKKELRKLMVYFENVDLLDIHFINWKIQFNRTNQTYQMLIAICYLVINGLLQTNSEGTTRLMDFLDERCMSRLYEKFILEYYRKEFPQLSANASQIPWALDDGSGELLPVMQTDIMLNEKNRILIIDAKYYSHTTQVKYDARTIHSGNLYQIFTYVKNKEAELAGVEHNVSGMLLYARTDETIQPNNIYRMSGNKIAVKTLDLNCNFKDIADQLNQIAIEYFDIKP